MIVAPALALGAPAAAARPKLKLTSPALDEPVTIGSGSTIDDLRAAIKGMVRGKAKLVGRFAPESGTA